MKKLMNIFLVSSFLFTVNVFADGTPQNSVLGQQKNESCTKVVEQDGTPKSTNENSKTAKEKTPEQTNQ